MSQTYYSKDHEYVILEDKVATIGITDYAQKQLGDIVFVELPEAGAELEQGGEAAVVESVKAASEVYAPISGTVTEVNPDIEADPSIVNQSAETGAWFLKLEVNNVEDLDGLMDEDAYKSYIEGLE